MPNQKTWTGKVGDTKTFTISTVPADASDAAAVVAATTATSRVTKNENGGFDGTIAAEGSATFTFTSGEFTTSINVTGQPAS